MAVWAGEARRKGHWDFLAWLGVIWFQDLYIILRNFRLLTRALARFSWRRGVTSSADDAWLALTHHQRHWNAGVSHHVLNGGFLGDLPQLMVLPSKGSFDGA